MDTYPCPACGGVADETDGCRSCGRPHDPVAATLARLNQAMVDLDDETRRLADDQSELRQRRMGLQAQRVALTHAIAQRLADEATASHREGRPAQPTPAQRTPAQPTPAQRTPAQPTPARPGPIQPTPAQRSGASSARPAVRAETLTATYPMQSPVEDAPVGAETSPRSAQNTLLTLGGVLLGIAAIVFTGLFYTTTQTGGRAFILAIATTLGLGIPVLLARRTLTATAETIAGFGLLLVLLDGYTAYSADLSGLGSVSAPLYAAILLALVAGVAAAYRLATHLRAPQFAGLLATAPLLPLVAVHLDLGRDGFAAVLAVVAAQNLGAVALFGRDLKVRLPSRPETTSWAPPGGSGRAWPRMLRELAWVLFGAAMAMSVGLAIVGLVRAASVGEAVRSSLVLLLAAAVGVVAGQVSRRDSLRHIATGAAALAVIAAVSRVNALALPQYTLVLTAAISAGIAIVAGWLPADARRGPQMGSLIGAALAALVVTASALGTAAATVRTAITPAVWAADLTTYAARVHTTSWQIPVAAVLLAMLAVLAAPPSWRIDAVVIGGVLVVLTAPGVAADNITLSGSADSITLPGSAGGGPVSWWAVPLLAAAASSAATVTALFAQQGRSALIRSGSAGLLGLYAVATSLARPELTAATCAILALVAAATALTAAGWPDHLGPFADRVADSAGGAAAFTLPIAVGAFAWLGGAAPAVLVPLTMLATALGVLGAALSQVAAQMPRTGSAGGALAAAIGVVVFSVQADGALADIGLGLLLLIAAGATAAARAFEVAKVDDGNDIPAERAGSARELAAERTHRRRALHLVDGTTLGAALATAALIFAMARLLAVAIPGVGLVTTTAMVLAVSIGVVAMPESWRLGPRLGAGAVGGTIAVVTAGIAATEAVRAIVASTPFWAADLASWRDRVSEWAPYGAQVPASLLLAAAAAWALLPARVGRDVGFVTGSLAGIAAPAAFGLDWWSPIVIAGVLALAAGVGAALLTSDLAPRRLGIAAVLGLYASAAAGATPGSTALLLSAIVGAGVLVAAIAATHPETQTHPENQSRGVVAPVVSVVPGVATAASLIAAPGAAATIAIASGATRTGVLGSALGLAAFGVLVVGALTVAGGRMGGRVRADGSVRAEQRSTAPAFGVATAALVVAMVCLPDIEQGQVWAAAAAVVAVAAAATVRWNDRAAMGVLVATAGPAALLAAVASAPAWLTALVGPYRTLRQVWQGYAVAPVPEGAATAMLTLLLLAVVAAGTALTLGGQRYLLAAVLPPLAALALVAPTALGAPRAATPWVALGVAVATGLGAALSPPTWVSATRLLRGTAGMVCAFTGAAGFAGGLATRGGTLAALGVVLAAAVMATGLGRDPAVRMVAWIVASAAAFALPVIALAAADRPLWPSAFGILAICGLLVATAWTLARTATRVAEAAVVELCACLGAMFALLLTLGSARHAAAVLTIWGLLLGAAALARDRPPVRRQWLVRAALGAEVGACWLLLYSVEVGLTEAYTLPFAAVCLLAGALELRRRPELSSWVAYGPALAGGYLPSLALVLVGQDAVWAAQWRWVALFAAAIATVIVGSWRRRRAPVVAGTSVAVIVAITEMIRLVAEGALAGAVLVAVAGVVLIVFGAFSEKHLRGALRNMS